MNEKAGVRKTTNSNQSDSELAECKREWKMFITTFLDTTVTSQSRERLGRERRGKKMMGGERTRTRRPKQLRGREKKYDQYGWKGLVNPTVGESSDKKKKRKKKSEIRTKDKIGECVGKFSNKTSYGIIGFAVVHQGREKGISGITWQWWWVGSVWGLMWRREEKADHQSMDEVLWRQDWLRRTKMKWVRWVVGFFFYYRINDERRLTNDPNNRVRRVVLTTNGWHESDPTSDQEVWERWLRWWFWLGGC